MSVHSPLGAVGHVVSPFSSQKSFNDLQTSTHPRSVYNVSKLDLTLPPKGDTWLARCIPNCPQLEDLKVCCDSKGEGKFTVKVKVRGEVGRKYVYAHSFSDAKVLDINLLCRLFRLLEQHINAKLQYQGDSTVLGIAHLCKYHMPTNVEE